MKVQNEAEMLALGWGIAQQITPPVMLELVGDVGAGKTTFTRGLALGLSIAEPITSPSFTISKRYMYDLVDPQLKQPISGELIHYDFYRLEDPGIMKNELLEAISSPHAIVVAEWSDSVANILPQNRIKVLITLRDDGSREVSFSGISADKITHITSDLWKTCVKLQKNSGKHVQNLTKSVQNPLATCGKSVQKPQKVSKQAIKVYLDTSTDTCILRLNDKEYTRTGRYDLAERIFSFILDKLQENNADWHDISELTYYSGPGSFTGLRIGAAIVNALAAELQVPLYDHHGKKHQIILPEYGREANISAPKK